MHNTFQRDLCRLKLETARSYVRAITFSLAPVITSHQASLKISAQVQGLGPIFHLTVNVQNTSPAMIVIDHYVAFKCNESLYRINKPIIQVSS